MTNISCVIHTYNSEKYLEQCLESVSWVDEIIIIDMYSNDNTLKIAKQYKCKIFMHENVGYADPARSFGLEKCSKKWILSLDSDEIIMPKLKDCLIKNAYENTFDVIKISFRNFFFGKELKGSGWSYKQQVHPRFFKNGFINYTSEIHNFIKISKEARIGEIINKEKSILHYNYDSVYQFINKINRYTEYEIYSKNINYYKKPLLKIMYHFLREIIGRFIYMHGYRDGWIGLYLALGMAFYRASAVAKANLPKEDIIIQTYRNYQLK